MLRVMRDTTADHARRDAMAKAVAPYCHPHLTAVAVTDETPRADMTEDELIKSIEEQANRLGWKIDFGHSTTSRAMKRSVTWTACHFGGHRPWFVCSIHSSGRYCGRRVAVLYLADKLFACRRCYGLTYASQREALYLRDVDKAQKIRMRLGGSTVMSERFPDKPKGMHWRTYDRLRHRHDLAERRSMMGLMRFIEWRDQRAGGRH